MAHEKVDVVIVGSGSAGICAAAWMARMGVRCKVLERRDGPLLVGQADGVQCRTVEMFDSFGMSEEVLREAFHILEVAFWSADGDRGIVRTGRTVDTAPGLSHMPHVILNQARINGLLLDAMRRWNDQDVDYGYDVRNVEVDSAVAADPEAYPVMVTAVKGGEEVVFQAKYALGCDGAHSSVRRALGYKMIGDSTDAVWGVMDIYPRTDFPDIRKKATLHSESGNLLIIPREGGSLCRFYIELPHGTSAKAVKQEDLVNAAQAIFRPYALEIADTFWWSAYSVGQRLVDHFSKDNRVFLTGDACHTHAPKAGQGMNTSLQDGYNIGWKLASVLKGVASSNLLKTYNIEREKVAAKLIEFDRDFTKLFSAKVGQNGITAEHFKAAFIQSGKYTAGLTSTYDDSCITSAAGSTQSLATNLTVGMRFPSTQVVRFCDAKAMHLTKALPSDGRWRLVIFAGDIEGGQALERLDKLGQYLESTDGPVRRFTPPADDIDSFIEPIVVLFGEHVKLEQKQIHDYFWPVTGKWRMRDLHKVFVDEESYNSGHGHAYDFYGVDPAQGVLVIVRPDQYVSAVYPLHEHELVSNFFKSWALPRA